MKKLTRGWQDTALVGDDFDASHVDAAPEPEPILLQKAEPVQLLEVEPVKPSNAELDSPRSSEPVAPATPELHEHSVTAAPVTAATAAAALAAATPVARAADVLLVGETDEQGIAGAVPEQRGATAPANPAVPKPASKPTPGAQGAASAAAAAEAARHPPPVVTKHVPRAPLPAPALGAGPVQSFKEALPRVGASVMGACALAFLAAALLVAWRWTAAYGLLAALPSALLGLGAALLAVGGYVVTQHILPLTAPLTCPPPESLPALARRIVRPSTGKHCLPKQSSNYHRALLVSFSAVMLARLQSRSYFTSAAACQARMS